MLKKSNDFLIFSIQVLRQAGILQDEIVGRSVTTLNDNGFETPLLMIWVSTIYVQKKTSIIAQQIHSETDMSVHIRSNISFVLKC